NPVTGVAVTFAVAPGNGSVTGGSQTTNGSGIAIVGSWTLSQTVGTNTLTAAASGSGITGNPVTFTGDGTAGTATQMAFTVPPSNTPAGAVITPPVQVTARDAFGNTATQFTGNSSVAAVCGVATLSALSIDKVGTGYTVTASSGALSGTSPAFNITGSGTVSASQSTVVATSPITTGGGASTITVTAKDTFGNPIAGATVTLAATPTSGNTLTQPAGTTDANGVATGTLSSTAAGQKTVSATINGVAITQTATVVVNPGPAATIAANSPTSQTAAAGTAVSSPPSVIVKDANGNPVAGVSVTFSPAAGSGTVTGGSQMTNTSGVATVGSWTLSATAGSNTLTATSGSLSGSPVTFTATGTAGASATMAKSSGDNLTGQVATRLQTPHVVLVSDANGNPVTGVTVTWAAASGGGSVDPATSTTDADGHAQTFRTLGILIGTQTTTATATIAGKDTTVTFSISATAAGASQMSAAGGDGQTGSVGTTLPTPLSVRVADLFGNPVAGVTVTWTPASGSGSVNPTTSTTNTNGIATTTWTLGTRAGTQTTQATAAGSPVTFTATATPGPPTQLVLTTPPSASAQSGVALAQQPVV